MPGGRDFGAGDVLFNEGDESDAMFVIRSGAVRLHKAIDGQDTTVAELAPGDFCGEVSVVLGGPQPVSATATAPTKCLVVNADTLEQMVTSEAAITVSLIQGLARRVREMQTALEVLARRDSQTRIVMALIRHCENGEKRSDGVWIPRRLTDLAKEVAVPKAELGEVSKQLLKLKLLRSERNGILVPEVSRLYDLVKSGGG